MGIGPQQHTPRTRGPLVPKASGDPPCSTLWAARHARNRAAMRARPPANPSSRTMRATAAEQDSPPCSAACAQRNPLRGERWR